MTSAAPGWYADSSNPTLLRWWDGTAWTEHTAPAQPAAAQQPTHHAPQPSVVQPYATSPSAPEGAHTGTPYIWLIIFLPLLPMLPLFFLDWSDVIERSVSDPYGSPFATFGLLLSPAYVSALLLGWAVYGISIFFAIRDHRTLLAAGVPRPFHWAFVFIGSWVYPIGRSVVVKRRTGRDGGTLLASILALVGTVLLAFALAGVLIAQAFTAIEPYVR